MMISTLRLPKTLSLKLFVHKALIEVYIETPGGTHVTTAFTYMMGSPLELRRSIHGVNFVLGSESPAEVTRINVSDDIKQILECYPIEVLDYKKPIEPFPPLGW